MFLKDKCPNSPILYFKQNKKTQVFLGTHLCLQHHFPSITNHIKGLRVLQCQSKETWAKKCLSRRKITDIEITCLKEGRFFDFLMFSGPIWWDMSQEMIQSLPTQVKMANPKSGRTVRAAAICCFHVEWKISIYFIPYHIFSIFKCSHKRKIRGRAFFLTILD